MQSEDLNYRESDVSNNLSVLNRIMLNISTLLKKMRLLHLLLLLALIAGSYQQAMAASVPAVDPPDDIVIEVIAADLAIDTVPEESEEEPGGYVRVNHDDDNLNKTPDLNDSGAIDGEDDLLVLKLTTWRPRQDIPVTLAVNDEGKEKVRVWTGPDRTNELNLPFTWSGTEAERGWLTEGSAGETVSIPDKLYVEGIKASDSSGDVVLKLCVGNCKDVESWLGGTVKDSARDVDSVSLTVVEEGLRITPQIVFIPGKEGVKDLSVTLNQLSGSVDVRDHDSTEYHWVGKTYTDDNPIIKLIKAKALKASKNAIDSFNKAVEDRFKVNPGLDLIKDIDVKKGKLKVGEPGFQIVWATHNGIPTENVTLVFVGLILDSIQLEPNTLSKLTMSHILTRALGELTPNNRPLVLSNDDNGTLSDKGEILLAEMTFTLLDKGPQVSLGAIGAALTEVVREFSMVPLTTAFVETGAAAPYFAAVVSHTASYVIREATKKILTNLVAFESSNESIAKVSNAAFSLTEGVSFAGNVQSHKSGFAGIKGTLDLGWLGKASDTVVTWVLPDLETVDIEAPGDLPGEHTAPILLDPQSPAEPGPPVRAFATTKITEMSEIDYRNERN